MKLSLELIVLLPLLGSLFNALFGRIVPRRLAETVACAMIWGSFAAALAAALAYSVPVTVEMASWLSAFDFRAPLTLYLDSLSLILCLMITFVCGLIHVYAVGYMRDDPGYCRFFALLNLFVAAMLLLVLAENLPLLYLGWEGVGFCSYFLIGFWYQDPNNATAGRKAFIVTRIGDVGLAFAIVWIFQLFGTVSITQVNQMGQTVSLGVITGLGLLMLLGAMGKSAQVPLMVWLPDAMAGPTPVSAQIHAATMVTAGVYLLMRLFPLIGLSATVTTAIAITGAVSAFYGATCALVQRDLKRILAYSTISQIGYMVLGVGVGALTASTFHLIEHAFFKALLFLGAGCVITALHHEQDIFRMGGLRRTLPATFYPFLAGALCLAGLPLTGGFFSKDGILAAVWQQGGLLGGGLYVLSLLTALLTAVYTFRMVFLIFGGNEAERPIDPALHETKNNEHLPAVMQWTLIPLALLGLGGGLLNLPAYLGQGWMAQFLAPLDPGGQHGLSLAVELTLQGLAALISLAGVALAWFRFGGARRAQRLAEAEQPARGLTAFLLAGWYVDALYRLLFVRPYVWLSGVLWQGVDEGLVDHSFDQMGTLLGRCGRRLGSWSCGRVSIYLLSLSAGAALCIGWFAWGAL
jgi:NADH-quinone oxidoreductase subunit L